MALRQPLRSLASALCVLLALAPQNAIAVPYPKDGLHAAGYGYLMPRQCNQYCGYDNQYCCSAGSQCYTSDGIAGCSVDAGGGYAFYTTTWTSTGTFTSTFSSFFPAATGNGGADCIPPPGSGQVECGSICCASWQICAYKGQCVAKDKVPGPLSSGLGGVTTQFSAPYRVTSGIPTGPTTVTTTGTAAEATTTDGGVAPGGTAGGGLSPGAIAGIVIGTLAGIVLLILICACCIIRGLWHGALAILGLGKKKKETVIEEEYRRSSSRHSRRDGHGSWYGGGGRPSTVASRKEKKSSGKGLLGLGAALGTLWLLLGLKKSDKKKSAKSRSDVSSSYWSDSYTATSPSKFCFIFLPDMIGTLTWFFRFDE
jgi:hypothetical protein